MLSVVCRLSLVFGRSSFAHVVVCRCCLFLIAVCVACCFCCLSFAFGYDVGVFVRCCLSVFIEFFVLVGVLLL